MIIHRTFLDTAKKAVTAFLPRNKMYSNDFHSCGRYIRISAMISSVITSSIKIGLSKPHHDWLISLFLFLFVALRVLFLLGVYLPVLLSYHYLVPYTLKSCFSFWEFLSRVFFWRNHWSKLMHPKTEGLSVTSPDSNRRSSYIRLKPCLKY